ncbi:MAG: hypothetical protein LBC02_09070 [Planctomycetaceae bacterium]|nr:hypothetical protein [Planctomycetaceae bacterium]
MVVNLSPKGWSTLADSAPVFGRQLVLPTGLLSDFRPNTKASRLVPTRWWVKALRRNIAYFCNYSVEFSQTYGNRFNRPHFQPNFSEQNNLSSQ